MRNRSVTALAIGIAACATQFTFAQSASSPSEFKGSSDQKQPLDQKAEAWHSSKESKDVKDMQDMKQIRASKLIGINVSSKDGDNFGQVQDLVIDPKTGKIQFALVGQGFMAGLGHQLVPVPWQAVNVRSEREFALNVDKKKLESAPTWTQSQMEQPDYTVRIYRFYELEPQSDVGGPGASEEQSGQGQGSSSESDLEHQSSPQQQPDQQQSTHPQP